MRYRQAENGSITRQEAKNTFGRHYRQRQAAERATVIAGALTDDLLRLSPKLLARDIMEAFGVGRGTALTAIHMRVAGSSST